MRDSSSFKAPAGHRVKPATDEIQRIIEINDFEEAILKMTGFVALNVIFQGRTIQTFHLAQLAVLSLLLWRIW